MLDAAEDELSCRAPASAASAGAGRSGMDYSLPRPELSWSEGAPSGTDGLKV